MSPSLPLDALHHSKQGNLMNLTRTTITAGLAALSLAASATPALAKGGVDPVNNTVITFNALIAPAPSGANGGNGGGGGRPATCRAVGIDPVTGSILMSCTQARA
jgi:hypothetical protein